MLILVLILRMVLKLKNQFIRLINWNYQRNKYKKSNILFFDNMINFKNFDSDLLKIDKKSYKKNIYYIGYITIKDTDYVTIHSTNHLYFIFDKVYGYIEESNGNKYLALVCNDKNKGVLTKYTKLWNKIKNVIEKINNKPGEYEKYFMKIKFSSDDNLLLNT